VRCGTQACICQDDIDASLAVLPIFLSGCKTLLILPGASYSTRLWWYVRTDSHHALSATLTPARLLRVSELSVVEIFVFLQMGGDRTRMIIRPLELGDEDLHRSLLQFDARKAQCFLAKDRQKLLAVVEASFGTFGPFNRIVRGFFAEEWDESARAATRRGFRSSSAAASSSTAAVDVEMEPAVDGLADRVL
jgi:hypothetical protein